MLQNAMECGTIEGEKEEIVRNDSGLAYILGMTIEEKQELLEMWNSRKENSQ